MEYNKFFSKKLLIWICIVIGILIIFRILYSTLYFTNIEGFETPTNLVPKETTSLVNDNIDILESCLSTNDESCIYSWNNQLQNLLKIDRPIAFYKPKLNNNKHKLGDMVSQNADYSPPTETQFTVLINKPNQNVSIPLSYETMVEIKIENFDKNFYTYTNTINSISNLSTDKLNTFKNTLKQIIDLVSVTNLNSIIQKNLSTIQTNFRDDCYKKIYLSRYDYNEPKTLINDFITKSVYENIKGPGMNPDFRENFLWIPAGATIAFEQIDRSNNQIRHDDYYFTFFTDKMDNNQDELEAGMIEFTNVNNNSIGNIKLKNQNILNLLSEIKGVFTFNESMNIETIELKSDLMSFIPFSIVKTLITELCNYILTIENINPNYLTILNLSNANNAKNILEILNNFDITNIKSITKKDILPTNDLRKIDYTPEYTKLKYMLTKNLTNDDYKSTDLYSSYTIGNNVIDYTESNTILGNMLKIIFSLQLKYKTSRLGTYIRDSNYFGMFGPTKIRFPSYKNDIIDKMSITQFNINNNSNNSNKTANNSLITQISNINSYLKFTTDISNNQLPEFPLVIFKPIAPPNYISLGHVFGNFVSDKQLILQSNTVVCIPSHCVKEVRDWLPSDKIYEYNKNGKYFGIYYNPYTGTFISTNTNPQQLPDGKVSKVVACVKKCDTVDNLQKADDWARKIYTLNKQAIVNSPISSTLVSNQEDEFYLNKIKTQSDSITRLKTRAQQMQSGIDKATIVNSAMNQNKLQNYVDTQKTNIDIIMKRIQSDRNKIQTNIKIPPDTIKDILQMIQNSSELNTVQKTNLVNKIIDSQQLSTEEQNANIDEVLASCPQYDLSNLVSKKTVSDVCYGCDNPV